MQDRVHVPFPLRVAVHDNVKKKKMPRVATGTKRILLPQIRESYEATNDTLGKQLKTIRPAKSWTGHPVQQERLWLVG